MGFIKKISAGQVLPLFILLFILFSTVILGDNVTESLLISNFSTTVLPVMFIVNACFLFLISLFFITLIDRLDRGLLLLGFLALHGSCLLFFRFLIGTGFGYVYPLLYSYAYVTKIICFLVFWTVANDVISAREAKESFPVIAGGGVIGGVLVSFSVIFLVTVIPTDNLLYLWAGLIFLTLPLVWRIRARSLNLLKTATALPAGNGKVQQLLGDFRIVRGEVLLRNMGLIYFLIFILLFAHDYLFLSTLKQTFLAGKSHFYQAVSQDSVISTLSGSDLDKYILKREIPRFLGFFKGFANLCTFLLQITVAGFLLKKLGTARAMLVMPLIFGITFLCVVLILTGAFPAAGPTGYPFFGSFLFLALALSLVLRVAAFDSIYSPNFQIFFSTLAKEIRGRGKIFLEGIIKPAAILLSGVIIISIFPKYFLQSMVVLLVLTVVLLWRCLEMKRVYSESIYRFLGGDKDRKIRELMEMKAEEADEAFFHALSPHLDDPDRAISDFALSTLIRCGDRRAMDLLWNFWERSKDPRRAGMVHLLLQTNSDRFAPFYLAGLKSASPAVVAESIRGVSRVRRDHDTDLLIPFANHADPAVRAAAITALWRDTEGERRSALAGALKVMISSRETEVARQGLSAISEIADPALAPLLSGVSPGKQVKSAFLSAAGRFPSEATAKVLLDSIDGADAEQAAIIEEGLKVSLALFPALLEGALSHDDIQVRRIAVRALLADRGRIDEALRARLHRLAEEEIRRIYRMAQYAHLLKSARLGEEVDALAALVGDHLVFGPFDHVINIFRALTPTDILSSVAGKATSANKHVRSSAMELIENNVDAKLAKLFIPLCEEEDSGALAAAGKSRWHFDSPQDYLILAELFKTRDRWIRAFALYAAARLAESRREPEYLKALNVEPGSVEQALSELAYG